MYSRCTPATASGASSFASAPARNNSSYLSPGTTSCGWGGGEGVLAGDVSSARRAWALSSLPAALPLLRPRWCRPCRPAPPARRAPSAGGRCRRPAAARPALPACRCCERPGGEGGGRRRRSLQALPLPGRAAPPCEARVRWIAGECCPAYVQLLQASPTPLLKCAVAVGLRLLSRLHLLPFLRCPR